MKELSPPAARALLHTRQITCAGYQRDDGLWEVEGRLSDLRNYQTATVSANHFKRMPGEPLHLMSLRLTIDSNFVIVNAEAVTHAAPYPECPQINDSYRQLVGLTIQAGFIQAVKTRFRGSLGCTHLTDLLGPLATTALQTMRPKMATERILRGEPPPDEGPRPAMLDSCHALRCGGEAAVVRWGKAAELGD
jgi:Protein of unknown function (DUF2889)